MRIVILIISMLMIGCAVQKGSVSQINNDHIICMHVEHIAVDEPIYYHEIYTLHLIKELDTIDIDSFIVSQGNVRTKLAKKLGEIQIPEIIKEMRIDGRIFYETAIDSLGNFGKLKILRGICDYDELITNQLQAKLLNVKANSEVYYNTSLIFCYRLNRFD